MKKTAITLLTLISVLLLSLIAACAADNGNTSERDDENVVYTLNYFASEGGKIDGKAEQMIKAGGDGESVTAIANDGYRFLRWSDYVYTAERQDKDIENNKSVTAEFRKIICVINYSASEGGTISGKTLQKVNYGEDCEEVVAVPDPGAHFVEWSDGVKTPERQDLNVSGDIDVTAKFEYKEFTVTYLATAGGFIYGETVQKVRGGEDAQAVNAVAEANYEFISWSDGIKEANRIDKIITSDITITAEFKGIEKHIRFTAGKGGRIIGNLEQTVRYGEDCKEVVAVPDEGYVFGGWSDADMNLKKVLHARIKQNKEEPYNNYEFIAYFEPFEKHFDYDCGFVSVVSPQKGITLTRSNLSDIKFYIPECSGYIFRGWYADEEYKLKAVDSDGTYMLGYYGLRLETNSLYARWSKEGETDGKIVHKVLFVMPQEIHASLKSQNNYYWDSDCTQPPEIPEVIDVDYRMTSVEYTCCGMVIEKFEELLNNWFANTNIRFEVDSYYTVLPLLQENFVLDMNYASYDFCLKAYHIQEIAELLPLYHNVIVMQGLHDYYGYVRTFNLGGSAVQKYANVYMDIMFAPDLIAGHPFEDAINAEYHNGVTNSIMGLTYTCIHEFIHTCEKYFEHYILDWHLYEGKSNNDFFEGERKYLLGEAEYDGSTSKVLMERYFINNFKVSTNYTGAYSHLYKIIGRPDASVDYGATVTVKVVPNEGYRFVKWSDGVTTAERTDKIISHLKVYPVIAERTALKIVPLAIDSEQEKIIEGGGYFIITFNGETIKTENLDMDFPCGAVVTVEAFPNEGYIFNLWEGNINERKVTFTVDSFIKTYAYFSKLN